MAVLFDSSLFLLFCFSSPSTTSTKMYPQSNKNKNNQSSARAHDFAASSMTAVQQRKYSINGRNQKQSNFPISLTNRKWDFLGKIWLALITGSAFKAGERIQVSNIYFLILLFL
jgi:hypothetical protein